MNTPAHIIISLGLTGSACATGYAIAIALGALFPDALMFLFYAWERMLGVPEQLIWNRDYYLPFWQSVFDLTNSIPIYVVSGIVLYYTGRRAWFYFCLSAVIHCILDLMVHREDAHRHFYPFSDFRYVSPVSYWDPDYYGHVVTMGEVALVAVLAVYLWRKNGGRADLKALRATVLVTVLSYAGFLAFAAFAWM